MATHSSALFMFLFFWPQRASLFTAKDLTIATHINSLRTFLLSFTFLAMSCRKKNRRQNTPHWSGVLGWEEMGSEKARVEELGNKSSRLS